jgi:hypothetical protein
MKKSLYKQLDVALLQWFNQTQAGVPISHPMCAQKAKFLPKAVGLQGKFKASSVLPITYNNGICGIAVQGKTSYHQCGCS